jgi:hypothetical protein
MEEVQGICFEAMQRTIETWICREYTVFSSAAYLISSFLVLPFFSWRWCSLHLDVSWLFFVALVAEIIRRRQDDLGMR